LPKTSKFLLVSMFFASSVFAQSAPPVGGPVAAPDAPVPPPSPAAGNGQQAAGSGQVDISVKQSPSLTPQEMQDQGKEYFRNMNESLQHIQTLQETARRQKDIIKLNCVTDKLVQAKVNINIAEQAMTSLQENTARNDEGGRTHEFTRLTIVNQKVLVLGAEAENCIGEDLSFIGATRVDVEVDPNIPQNDPTAPTGPTIDIVRPQPASNFL
jgi:ribosomal protein S25